jgi:hypothetical protein
VQLFRGGEGINGNFSSPIKLDSAPGGDNPPTFQTAVLQTDKGMDEIVQKVEASGAKLVGNPVIRTLDSITAELNFGPSNSDFLERIMVLPKVLSDNAVDLTLNYAPAEAKDLQEKRERLMVQQKLAPNEVLAVRGTLAPSESDKQPIKYMLLLSAIVQGSDSEANLLPSPSKNQ